VREPSHRLTQHKRRGGRSLLVLWDPEEAPTLFFKGSKPGAATAGWSLFSWTRLACLGRDLTFSAPRVRRGESRSNLDVGPKSIQIDECSDRRHMSTKRSTRAMGSPGFIERSLAELAEQQHGVVAQRQLRGLGISKDRIRGRLRRRQLHPIHRGVYAYGFRLVGNEARWMAAVLACGPDAVLSHRSAAQLWGLQRGSSWSTEVTRAKGWRAPDGVVAHRAELPDDERTVVDGIPVTTSPRTILDLAAVASRRQVERALNEVEVLGLTDRLSIPDLLSRYPRRRGTAVLCELLDDAFESGGVTENDFEELFVPLLDSHGLPRPRFNADIAVAGRFFRADCLWRKERLIVELDGRAAHGTRKAFESDRERDRLLMVDGWLVMRITWRQLRTQQSAIASDLRRALASRSTLSA
jgi:very-short-patch-repair endonuclease